MAKRVLHSSLHKMFSKQFPDCQRENDQAPTVTDFVAQIQNDKIVVRCMAFHYAKLNYFPRVLLAAAVFSNTYSRVFLQQDCSVATCSVFKCSRFMGRTEKSTYNFSAIMTSGWIQQVKLVSRSLDALSSPGHP